MRIEEWLNHRQFLAGTFVLARALAGGPWPSGDPVSRAEFDHSERQTSEAASPPDAQGDRVIETLEHVQER